MACTLKEIKTDGINKVKQLFKGGAKSITFDNDVAIINYTSNVKNKQQAYKMAIQKIKKINQWSKDTFKTDAFTDQWATIYQTANEVRVEFSFPRMLLEAYNKKINESDLYYKKDDVVNFTLKAIDILKSDKGVQVFKKGKKNNWSIDKILAELQIPKLQKRLITDRELTDREDMIISLESNNSFLVELKTTKYQNSVPTDREEITVKEYIKVKAEEETFADEDSIEYVKKVGNIIYTKITYTQITQDEDGYPEYSEGVNYFKYKLTKQDKFTEFYKRLSVPGGINYREMEISTPEIIPVLKGHADFSTNNGIGWFRVDEEVKPIDKILEVDIINFIKNNNVSREEALEYLKNENDIFEIGHNTRRVLELQSDLFQKSRDKDDLITPSGRGSVLYNQLQEFDEGNIPSFFGIYSDFNGLLDTKISVMQINNNKVVVWKNKDYDNKIQSFVSGETKNQHGVEFWVLDEITSSKFLKEYKESLKEEIRQQNILQEKRNKNQFLQLLNKNNNWVNFFIESIIQDSAKNGYNTVLFPKGSTVFKIEGLDSIETYDEAKERYITTIKKTDENLKNITDLITLSIFKELDDIRNEHEVLNNNREDIKVDEVNKQIKKLEQKLRSHDVKAYILYESNISTKKALEILNNTTPEEFNKDINPVPNFYNQKVAGVLKRLYRNRIKDYVDSNGNEWLKVETNLSDTNNDILLHMSQGQDPRSIYNNDSNVQKYKSYFIPVNNISERDSYIIQDNLDSNMESLFDGELKTMPARKVVLNALDNLQLNEESKKIAKAFLNSKASITFKDASEFNSPTNTFAHYRVSKNQIEINGALIGTGNDYFGFEVVLHELVHEATLKSLLEPKTNKQRTFRDDMFLIFDHYNNLDDSGAYGFTKPEEFVAEIMSNERFRDHIRDLKQGESLSIWQRFIRALNQLFGIEPSYEVNTIIDSILEIAQNEYSSEQSPLSRDYTYNKEADNTKTTETKETVEDKSIKDIKKVISEIFAKIEAVRSKSRSSRGYANSADKKFKTLQSLMTNLYNKTSNESLFTFTKFAKSEINLLLSTLDRKVKDKTVTSDYLQRAASYISIYSSLDDIRDIAVRQYNKKEIEEEDYNKIIDSLKEAKFNFETFNTRYIDLARDILAEKLAKYNTRPLIERKQELIKEYNSIKPSTSKEDWINNKLDGEYESIKKRAIAQVRQQLEVIPMDIGSNTKTLVSEKNINNLILQLTSFALDKADYDARDFAVDIRNEFSANTKKYNAKGKNNKAKYGKLISQDSEGAHYLIGKYSPKFIEEYRIEQKKLNDIRDEFGFRSKEARLQWKKFLAWKKSNIDKVINDEGVVLSETPKSKWLDLRFNKLNKADKDYLNFLKSKTKDADRDTLGYKSLVYKYTTNHFYRLPTIRKTDLDMILSGEGKKLVKDKVGDFSKVREDDTTRGELSDEQLEGQNFVKKLVTINNEERHLVPIHFRNKIDPESQSLDLATIFLLNSSMSREFNVKNILESDMKMLIDVIGASKVTKVSPITNKILKSIFTNSDNELIDITIDGKDSNVYKKLNSIIENRVYKITQVSSSKVLGKDVATIANNISSYSAHLALAVNHLSAIPNLMQGKIQNFIEGVGKNTFTRADLRWAEKTYFKELRQGGINDIGTHTNNSKLSMLIDKFDLMGDFNAIKNNFEETGRFKALFKSSTLHGMNGVAEHYIQSTLMLAVMKAIQMKNKDGKYIDINGNETSKDKAMNLYEAFDVVDGKLKIRDNVHHSSFSRNDINDTGIIEHQSLIRKKIIDLHGQYDNKWQSDIQRYWWGKLIFMFRKWLIPAYHRRWRGMIHANTKYDELTDNQKYFDASLQEFQEGTYTSLMRFILKSVVPAIKEFKIEIIKSNWNELTDLEKSNIHKTLRELMVTSMMMTAASITYIAAKDAPDEGDKEMLYLLAYLFKRQETELQQYYSISDQLRIFRTPFASMSTAEKLTQWFTQILPWNIGDAYEGGENMGEYKAWMKTKRLIPVISQTERSAKESLSFLKTLTE